MYRYYQTDDFSTWILVVDENPEDPWAFAKKHNASRVSILALSNDPAISGADFLEHAGPWCVDIDDEDLGKALNSGVELCKKLLNLGVDKRDLEIHLSGGKGIHLFLQQKIFHSGKTEASLCDQYKELALSLYVPGMDMMVYSKGKGRMFRPPDSLRPDGRYKVLVDYEELLEINVEKYLELVSKPRGITEFKGPARKAKLLSGVFVNRAKLAKELQKKKSEKIAGAVLEEEDFKVMEESIPNCIELLAQGKRNPDTNFNLIAMNIACWANRVKIEPVLLDSLYTRVVENCPSSKGESQTQRKHELEGMHRYVGTELSKYKFSCRSLISTVIGKPCSGCPLQGKENNAGEIVESLYIYERNGHWYSDSEFTRVITSFTMERDKILLDEKTRVAQSSIVTISIPGRAESHVVFDFSEDAWVSKAALKKELIGIEGAAFLGTDNDVQRIRLTLAKQDIKGETMKETFKASKAGINYRKRSGPDSAMEEDHVGRLTYIEPEFSINDAGVEETHRLIGHNPITPRLRFREWGLPITDRANEAFQLLLRCNTPEVIAPMLGWFLLAHIKQHVYQVERRGILLCVSGVAGTGKNSLTAVLQRLCGLEGEDALYTLEAPMSTQMPFQQALSNSTTIPRVINELNPKSVTNQGHYRKILELLKASFDSQNIARGRLGGGDKNGANVSVVDWKITAPVITLSEEMISEPAVLQRSIRVDMTSAGRVAGKTAFTQLEPRADDLVDIARVLVNGALHTKIRKIGQMLKETELPRSMETMDVPDRLRFGYKSILVAYDWAIEVLSDEVTGLNEEGLAKLKEMRRHFIDHIEESASQIASRSSITEVDKILMDLAVMASYSSDVSAPSWALTRGKHFVIDQGVFYLDTLITYPQLQRFKNSGSEPLGIKNVAAFNNAVRSMGYFVSDKALTDYLPTCGRVVLSLDVEIMQERGIPVTMFL